MIRELSLGDPDQDATQDADSSDDEEEKANKGAAQFICTTFRPEMVQVAEKCYGVTYTNKTSSIDVVSNEDAMDFIEGVVSGR
jgi:structural maintenance of chromosome 3 (chondroitin sulfate proteoglycan 6)